MFNVVNVLLSQGQILECSLPRGDGLQQDQEAWCLTQDSLQVKVQEAAADEGIRAPTSQLVSIQREGIF